jgi:hypothetical protein
MLQILLANFGIKMSIASLSGPLLRPAVWVEGSLNLVLMLGQGDITFGAVGRTDVIRCGPPEISIVHSGRKTVAASAPLV